MTTLESVSRFIVPANIIRATDQQLRLAGSQGCERFVLWSGIQERDTFVIHTAHVPAQTAYRLPEGLCVRVDGPELHRLNVWMFEHNEELAVQVHAHPTDAYHSETDDTYPIVTVLGGLSIVVPNFGDGGLLGGGVAYYRLGDAGWNELTDKQARRIVQYLD